MEEHIYIACDLKSFYASVECVERGLNPLKTNLVVADERRTEKTICLAVSPSLKAYGISGRARLYEVIQRVKQINNQRRYNAPNHILEGKSYNADELKENHNLELSYIIAVPRMAFYIEYSTRIYNIYLKYFAPEDMHVYSIDEVFIDITGYLSIYKMSPRELAVKIINEILNETGITAAAGIGTNLYLCKIAMDIVAKHIAPDKNGVRIAKLDEMSYRKKLWSHRPITDFWRIGKGYAKKLESIGLYTMGDIARCSVGKENEYYNENLLYDMFGVNAELLIDHAWGYESCTIKEIKEYKPSDNSISSGQVLYCPYDFEKAELIVKEMTDILVLDLVEKGLVTNQIVLTIGYDIENLTNPEIRKKYKGEITTDRYGRKTPKHAHSTIKLDSYTSSTKIIINAAMELYNRIVNKNLLIRRINIAANHVISEKDVKIETVPQQLDIFTDYAELEKQKEKEEKELKKEKNIQKALIDIKNKFGKNAVFKGMNLQEGATAKERNSQIGGHKA